MKNFKEHIKQLESDFNTGTTADLNTDKSENNNPALERLYENTLEAVNILNGRLNSNILNIIRIEDELAHLLFSFNERTTGFVLVTPQKYIFFISNNTGNIFTYGMKRKDRKSGMNLISRSVQLLTINYDTKNGGVVYSDSTGSPIDPEEIVYQIFKWVTL